MIVLQLYYRGYEDKMLTFYEVYFTYISTMYLYTCSYVCMYIAEPSCYIKTNCIGEPINKSVTFSDCCINFGVSYDLDGRCQACPRISKYFNFCTAYVKVYVKHYVLITYIQYSLI